MEPGWLQSMGSQRVRHDLATEQQQQETKAGGGMGKLNRWKKGIPRWRLLATGEQRRADQKLGILFRGGYLNFSHFWSFIGIKLRKLSFINQVLAILS